MAAMQSFSDRDLSAPAHGVTADASGPDSLACHCGLSVLALGSKRLCGPKGLVDLEGLLNDSFVSLTKLQRVTFG